MTADERWMRVALAQAEAALARGEIPVGAALVRDGTLLAAAGNEREALRDPSAHAELLALRRAAARLGAWRLSGCTLYVTLEPCPMCAGAILQSRISRVVYGARDPRCGCCGSVYDLPNDPALGGDIPWTEGVLAEACGALLKRGFAALREAPQSAGCSDQPRP